MKGEISMKFNSNKEKGNTGLGIAIEVIKNKANLNLCEKYEKNKI